ncbi:MAG: hypothetical protein ACI8ZB_002209 [Desulforhopalus sp.]
MEIPLLKRTLRPCIGNEVDAVEGIEYGVWRDGGRIGVEFDLYGLLSHLVIPAQDSGSTGKRVDDLWHHSCFELFVREVGEKTSRYFECNFSPSGQWNVYRFDSYRKKMEQADLKSEPVSSTEITKKIFTIRAEVDLTGLVPESSAVEIGVGCVVENKDGKLGYWALSHPGEKPDFHDPRSFIIRLIGTDSK